MRVPLCRRRQARWLQRSSIAMQSRVRPSSLDRSSSSAASRANSLGRLEQIESYAPGRQVRFGSLNYTADIRGDLIFDGFGPLPSALHCHDEHDLALPPNKALESAPTSASTPSSELTASIEDGRLDATSGAATPTAIEPSTSSVLCETRDSKEPNSSPDSEPSVPLPIESDWAPIMSSPPRTSFSTRLSAIS